MGTVVNRCLKSKNTWSANADHVNETHVEGSAERGEAKVL